MKQFVIVDRLPYLRVLAIQYAAMSAWALLVGIFGISKVNPEFAGDLAPLWFLIAALSAALIPVVLIGNRFVEAVLTLAWLFFTLIYPTILMLRLILNDLPPSPHAIVLACVPLIVPTWRMLTLIGMGVFARTKKKISD